MKTIKRREVEKTTKLEWRDGSRRIKLSITQVNGKVKRITVTREHIGAHSKLVMTRPEELEGLITLARDALEVIDEGKNEDVSFGEV